MKVLEWNVNSRSTGKRIPSYICTEILRKNPDIAVLVEFTGNENLQIIKESLSDYYIHYREPLPFIDDEKKYGNGLLIALSKKSFPEPLNDEDIIKEEKYNKDIPDYLELHTTWNNQPFHIVGIKVLVGNEKTKTKNDNSDGQKSKRDEIKDLESRKKQIEWILNKNNDTRSDHSKRNTIIIGDFNYGPHRNKFRLKNKINWQDILELTYHFNSIGNGSTKFSAPYSPFGTSHKSTNLDWLITKYKKKDNSGITIIKNSEYNQLDWSFGKYNSHLQFINGYLATDGNFIPNNPPYPDHAIFTAEIELHQDN